MIHIVQKSISVTLRCLCQIFEYELKEMNAACFTPDTRRIGSLV